MKEQVLIEVKDLSKNFKVGKNRVLHAVDQVSFTIEKGTTLGLVGESGCGKTTVGRTIMGLYKPDAGQIIFDGKDISKLTKKENFEISRKMQMIFQDPYASLNSFYTVSEIIGEGIDIHHMFRNKQEKMEYIYGLLEKVGLSKEHSNRFPHEFSGGQRQRIGIARALALQPEFIVCDEAIAALDVSIQAQVINMLMQFQEDMDLTYLFISHDLAMVRHISNHIMVMYMGNVMEYGETNEIFSNTLHPYTKGLIESVPVADPEYSRKHPLGQLDGEVKMLTDNEEQCKFCSRCKYATEVCYKEAPQLKEIQAGHFVACHNLIKEGNI